MLTFLIPKKPSLKEKKSGFGSPFWESYWKERMVKDPAYFRQEYEQKKKDFIKISENFNKSYVRKGEKYYVGVKLDERAVKKSNRPGIIWQQAGVKVVETREDGSLTLSGYSEDYKKLGNLLQGANFEDALKMKNTNQGNIAREIFSVTKIYDKNSTPDKRISKDVKNFLNTSTPLNIECVLQVFSDQEISQYNELYSRIVSRTSSEKIRKVNEEFFISNMSFRATLDRNDIKAILENEDCGFIRFIKQAPFYNYQRTLPSTPLSDILVGDLLTNETVVVIDSGIDNSILNSFVTHTQSFLESGELSDKDHGTSVASRLIFGDEIFLKVQNKELLSPAAKLIDFQVLHKPNLKNQKLDDLIFLKAIETGVRKHKNQAVIFNLSITDDNQIIEENISEATELIDYLSNKNDVLFICAAGNHGKDLSLGYDNAFDTPGILCHIAAPGDAINALTVGSITGFSNEDSLCKISGFPSPFTRKGGLRNDMKKPELVEIGGNIKIDPRDSKVSYDAAHMKDSNNVYGVQLINTNGPAHDIGTSFSVPLISRDCVLLLDYLKKSNLSQNLPNFNENKSNLIKALLIHSTTRRKQAELNTDGLKRAYGFGRPHREGMLRDNDNQVTIVYADKIKFSEQKQKILFQLPDVLLNKKMEFTFTLVYNPPVNSNFSDYKMIELKPSIGLIYPQIKRGVLTGKNESRAVHPDPSWDAYRNPHFNTIHFSIKRKLTKLDFQIMVQMMVSDYLLEEYAGHEDKISQNYALVLTIKDISNSGILRSEIIKSNQFHELIENAIQMQA